MEKEQLYRGLRRLCAGLLLLLAGGVMFRLPVGLDGFRIAAWLLLAVGCGVTAAAFARLAPLHTGYRIAVLAFVVTVFAALMHLGMDHTVRGMRLLRTLGTGAGMLCTIRATNAFLTAARRSDLVRRGRMAFYLFLAGVLISRVAARILAERDVSGSLRNWVSALLLVLMFAAFVLYLWRSAAWFGRKADAGAPPSEEPDQT